MYRIFEHPLVVPWMMSAALNGIPLDFDSISKHHYELILYIHESYLEVIYHKCIFLLQKEQSH